MPQVTMPDGTVVEMPDRIDPATASRLRAFQQSKSAAAAAPAPPPGPSMGALRNPIFNMFQRGQETAAQEMQPARVAAGVGEAALNMGTSAVAAPASGLAGIVAPAVSDGAAADVVGNVQQALTYQPRTASGQLLARIFGLPFEAVANTADRAGGAVTDATGSPALGTAANTLINFAPSLLFRRGPQKMPDAREAAARDYVARSGIDWDSLAEPIKTRLTDVAGDATALRNLDPQAVARQNTLETLPAPVPATRGQLTRDPVQLRNEGNVSATKAGKPIRDIHEAQNQALLDNLEILKGRQRGKAETPEQVGMSTQGALRAKLEAKKKEVKGLYELAEKSGEMQGRVAVKPVKDLIDNTPDVTHLGWVDSWLKKVGKDDLSLKEIEDLRQSAVAKAMNGGTDAYYAGKVIRTIDEMTEGAGGMAYKAARKARREQAMEFEEQAGVARLVDDKSRTDRATALEDTWRKTVIGGSIDDLHKVKLSLLAGKDKAAGKQAWRDIRAQTIQFIIDEATKSVTRTEKGAPNITPAAMDRAIKKIGEPKINEIFGAGTAQRLKQIMEATRIVKTEPPPGFKGSPTFANAIAFLERSLGSDIISGVVRGAAQVKDLGRTGREVKAATTTPLDDAALMSAGESRRGRARNALGQTAVTSSTAAERN